MVLKSRRSCFDTEICYWFYVYRNKHRMSMTMKKLGSVITDY